MKLSNRAKSALATAGYSVNESSAIAQLAAFAAQNSGIDPGNYVSSFEHHGNNPKQYAQGRKAYRDECRSISADWRRFKAALIEAGSEGVKDQDVIAEAPHAFSGRLEWHSKETWCNHCRAIVSKAEHNTTCAKCIGTDVIHRDPSWSYCTGQYFPTEYRKAAATLLEYATRRVRRSRPPEHRQVSTVAELKVLNEKNGGCWFGKGEMRFFGTRIESEIIQGKYFITSEQREDDTPRKFTVRSFDDKGDIDTAGEFHAYDSKQDALDSLTSVPAQP